MPIYSNAFSWSRQSFNIVLQSKPWFQIELSHHFKWRLTPPPFLGIVSIAFFDIYYLYFSTKRLKLATLISIWQVWTVKNYFYLPLDKNSPKHYAIHIFYFSISVIHVPWIQVSLFFLFVDNSFHFPLGRPHFLCYTYLSCMTLYIHQLEIYLRLLVAVQSWLTDLKIYFFVSFLSRFSPDNSTHTAVL